MIETNKNFLGKINTQRCSVTLIDSKVATRNLGFSIKLPKVKLETAKKDFYFNGGKLYNELPLEICKSDTLRLFTKELSISTKQFSAYKRLFDFSTFSTLINFLIVKLMLVHIKTDFIAF